MSARGRRRGSTTRDPDKDLVLIMKDGKIYKNTVK